MSNAKPRGNELAQTIIAQQRKYKPGDSPALLASYLIGLLRVHSDLLFADHDLQAEIIRLLIEQDESYRDLLLKEELL